MTHQNSPIHITINSAQYAVLVPEQSGATLKALASLPMDHVLERLTRNGEDSERLPEEILDDQEVRLADGDKFVIQAPDHHAVTVLINRQPYRFEDRHQTGRSLKERAGIPFADVLFLDRPKEDEVIPDDLQITLRSGERFHSAPPANYGHAAVEEMDVGFEYETLTQPDGWTWLLVSNYPLPDGYAPRSVTLLIKLPPAFPDAAPDMFWVSPSVKTVAGASPQGTSAVTLMGGAWQQFSWHLQAGAWQPGVSTLRDYLRCVRARFEKRN